MVLACISVVIIKSKSLKSAYRVKLSSSFVIQYGSVALFTSLLLFPVLVILNVCYFVGKFSIRKMDSALR